MQLRRRSAHKWRNSFLLVGAVLLLGVILNIPTCTNVVRSVHYAVTNGDTR
jgi:hypothetical protein